MEEVNESFSKQKNVMNQEDNIKPRIALSALPISVSEALAAFLSHHFRIIDLNDADMPDLLITGDEDGNALPAVPVFTLASHGTRPSLSRLRDVAADMVSAPSLYLGSFAIGDAVLKPSQKILSRAGNDIALTDKETDILIHLSRATGKPVSREHLLRRVWGYGDGIDTHTLETHVYRLRQKTGEDLVMTNEQGYYVPA